MQYVCDNQIIVYDIFTFYIRKSLNGYKLKG